MFIEYFLSSVSQLGKTIISKYLNSEQNIICSAYSAHSSMALLNIGATGDVEKHFTKELTGQIICKNIKSDLNKFHKKCLDNFKNLQNTNKNANLFVNNFIIKRKDIKLYSKFESKVLKFYDMIYKEVVPTENSINIINDFIREKTNGKIVNALSNLDPNFSLILINTIKFEGEWVIPFNLNETSKKKFIKSNGEKIFVDTMIVRNRFMFYEDEDFEIVKMYYLGMKFFMLFILPKNNITIDHQVVKNISKKENLEKVFSSFKFKNLILCLPKFKFDNEIDLTDIFFGANKNVLKDFKQISSYIGLNINVKQRACIEIDEFKTEAKAITITTVTDGGDFSKKRVVKFNKNFMFMLMHEIEENSNIQIFSGVINDPSF